MWQNSTYMTTAVDMVCQYRNLQTCEHRLKFWKLFVKRKLSS